MDIFIHGLDSSNRGTKSVFFRKRFPGMLTPNFSGSLQERMAKLEGILTGQSGIRLVGSSFGGLMASIFAMQHESRVDRLILLAPAIHVIGDIPYSVRKISLPVHIYHGTNDTVIPLKAVNREAKRFFHNLTFIPVDDDHYLHRTFKDIDWTAFLGG